ncbi:phage tail-collar fiber domain-containing protein [Pseudomonas atacamensis]|uniref:phage tail-collar fiber domain-containing protein n=1 Tax=Pseudomonas atacamensis TaxID=2565368 RepID=UPI00382D5430
MIDANSQFFAILTNVGMAKQANADALGIPWLITQMGVGDANPNGLADPPNPVPSASQTKLLNEWRRKPLNQLKIDPINPAVIIAEQIIPADEGGKWIREMGLYDADGDLVAVANCAPSFKPLLSQGSGRTQIVRMNFIVTSAGNIQLKIDPAIVLASRAYVDAAILEVLPKNKAAGQYTRVKVNDRGVFVSGDNPETLAGMGIKDTYTKTEIESMIAQASALPVGATVAFPLDKVAPGFLELDGSVKSIAVYSDLAAFLGTAFNKGDEGAGNFRLPESRGEFLRGWDHGRGVDAGRAIGSAQIGSYIPGDNNLADEVLYVHDSFDKAGLGWDIFTGTPAATTIKYTATQSGSTQLPVGGTVGHGGAARPRNIAVMWCIKAWNAPINQGNIDVAALLLEVQKLRSNGPVAGTARNASLLVTAASATANFTADELIVEDAAGSYRLNNFNKPINLAAVGLGGMDTGAAPANGYVGLYAIYNPASGVSGLLAVNAVTAVLPNLYAGLYMPAGFTASALVSILPTQGTGLFAVCEQYDRHVDCPPISILNTTVQTGAITAVVSGLPKNARMIGGSSTVTSTTSASVSLSLFASDASVGQKTNNGTVPASGQQTVPFDRLHIRTPQTIRYATSTVGGTPTYLATASSYDF